jgi:hypothetical protein
VTLYTSKFKLKTKPMVLKAFNERAYDLLCWQAVLKAAEYDETVDYTVTQQRRSDAALDAFDKAHPYEQSKELLAFYELESMGLIGPEHFFSPTKAKNGFYTKAIEHFLGARASRANTPRAAGEVSPSRPALREAREGAGLHVTYAQQVSRTWNRGRRQRQRFTRQA